MRPGDGLRLQLHKGSKRPGEWQIAGTGENRFGGFMGRAETMEWKGFRGSLTVGPSGLAGGAAEKCPTWEGRPDEVRSREPHGKQRRAVGGRPCFR
jgi:hypothetical protein